MRDATTNANAPITEMEAKMLFRADTDQHGDWYVWRRLGVNGWATMRRCDTREIAERMARTLNQDPGAALIR